MEKNDPYLEGNPDAAFAEGQKKGKGGTGSAPVYENNIAMRGKGMNQPAGKGTTVVQNPPLAKGQYS